MSNHPWRERRRMFNCPPNCPKRKPGCQDHCDIYAKDRAEWDKHRATERVQENLDIYTNKRMARYMDRMARSDKHGLLRKNGGMK